MATLGPLNWEMEQNLFRREVQVIACNSEARDPLFVGAVGRGRIEQVEPLVGCKIGIEGNSQQAIFII